MDLKNPIKRFAKRLARPLLYRFPPVFISSAGLYIWLDEILRTEPLNGAVVEIGCYLGGTAALGSRFLKEIGSERPYYAIDTFGGFVGEQFESELRHGGSTRLKHHFSANTPALARWVMDKHGGKDVRMIVGDVTQLPDSDIPAEISACLLDIDLAEPIYQALSLVYSRLVPGGVIVVDDCDNATIYKAVIGYKRFVTQNNLPIDIKFGKGLVRKPLLQSGSHL